MKKVLKKIVLQQHVSQDEIIGKKSQRWILGGSGGGTYCCVSNQGERCNITADPLDPVFPTCDQKCGFYTVFAQAGSC